MELGLHLPLMEFGDEGQSLARLSGAVNAARDSGFAAVSANDHFLFQTPWLDGATALAAVIDRSHHVTVLRQQAGDGFHHVRVVVGEQHAGSNRQR